MRLRIQRKTRDIQLVHPEDERYLDHCARYAQESLSLREKEETSSLNQLSAVFEAAVRQWLAQSTELMEHRILSYEELASSGEYQLRFREIDAVTGTGDTPRRFFEIKTASNPDGVLPKAYVQLSRSLSIARREWDDIAGCILLVDMRGDVGEPTDFPEGVLSADSVSDLDDLPLAPDEIALVTLDPQRVWDVAVQEGINTDEDLFRAAIQESADNATHRDERKRLMDAGIPSDQWPEHLKPQMKTVQTSCMVASEEPAAETAFEAAFRRARGNG